MRNLLMAANLPWMKRARNDLIFNLMLGLLIVINSRLMMMEM